MLPPASLVSRAWLLVLAGAVGFLFWLNSCRVAHVDYVSGLAGGDVPVEAASPTGYADGFRRLIVPEHNADSMQWIVQTQEMLAQRVWHLTQVGYDNAPTGREVGTPSPYRWWLGLLARTDHAFTNRPTGLAVERAARYADPLFQILLLIGTAVMVARQFGPWSAVLFSLGLAALFPLGGEFLPGQPTDHGFALACALWSVLPLVAASGGRAAAAPGSVNRWFLIAGVMGGLGLWINVARELPVLTGVAVGGLGLAALARRHASPAPDGAAAPLPWGRWALGGAVTCLAACLLEYLPARLGGFRLQTVHPLYALAWLGAGEIMLTAGRLFQPGPKIWTKGNIARLGLALLAVAAVPVAVHLSGNQPFFADNSLATRLTNLPDSVVAPNAWAWIRRDGASLALVAAWLPLLLIGPAVWLVARSPGRCAPTVLALAPVLAVLGGAAFQLHGWSELEVLLLALLVALAADPVAPGRSERRWRGLGAIGVGLGLVPGLLLLLAPTKPEAREVVSTGEVRELMERDLAFWLARQAGSGGPVVLAPPDLTTALIYFGGVRGLGTPYWENKAGFAAAVRIAGATSPDEAQIVARGRSLTHILMPSWDPFLDEYARLGSGRTETSLIGLLHHWLPPRWLRPVSYHLPQVAGMADQSLVIFKVVDVQDNAVALSRMAEYFVEMNRIGEAAAVGQALARLFPADLGAQVARTWVDQARGDPAATAAGIRALEDCLTRGDDAALPWDRRVSLAIALAEGRAFAPARAQARRCLAEMDEPRLRSLSSVALYRLLVLDKAFGLAVADPRLRELTRRLLPVEMRDAL